MVAGASRSGIRRASNRVVFGIFQRFYTVRLPWAAFPRAPQKHISDGVRLIDEKHNKT
jgi:hypothetical protein